MHKIFALGVSLFALQACTVHPHIEDWKRERYTSVPDLPLEVNICFDHTEHSRQMIYDMAREECGVRITEVENLVQTSAARQAAYQTKAEGQAFEGSVQRSRRIQAMVNSLQLKYISNNKWDCPLVTPNRITFQCIYNNQATDSGTQRQTQPSEQVSPDLPPELPDDLKPQ